jgi:site-specific DNA recombinase
MSVIESTVINGFKQNLVDAESIKEMTKAYHARRKENDQKSGVERDEVAKKLAKLTLNIDRLVEAVTESDEPVPSLVAKLKEKEAERVGLTERLRLLNAENVIALHPFAIETYKNSVDILHRSLLKGRNYGEAEKQAFRNLIDRVVVHPTGARKPYEVSVYGRLSALIGVEAFPNMRTVEEIVAEEAIPTNKTAGGRD